MTTLPQPAPGPAAAGRRFCRHCGNPLTPHQATNGAVCAAPACQRRKIQMASRAAFQRNWNDFVERQRLAVELAGPGIARALRRMRARPDQVAIGVVPHIGRPLVPLPADRRTAFERRLDRIISGAFGSPVPEIELAARERMEAAEHPLVSATCATCRGMCCALGGERHAFLEVSDLQRFRSRHPEADAAAIRAHYLGRLPERSVEHSCVYHAENGCTLDRADRADVCNRYHCNPLTRLLARMRRMQAGKAVIIAHEDDAGPVVSAFDMASGLAQLGDGRRGKAAPASAAAAIEAALAQAPAPLATSSPFIPPAARCEFCGAPLDRYRAVTSRCCGAAACAAARWRKQAHEATEHTDAALLHPDASAGEGDA